MKPALSITKIGLGHGPSILEHARLSLEQNEKWACQDAYLKPEIWGTLPIVKNDRGPYGN
jgi:hypothetical protein